MWLGLKLTPVGDLQVGALVLLSAMVHMVVLRKRWALLGALADNEEQVGGGAPDTERGDTMVDRGERARVRSKTERGKERRDTQHVSLGELRWLKNEQIKMYKMVFPCWTQP